MQTRRIPTSFQCNLCVRSFSILIMGRISVWVAVGSDLYQLSLPRECRLFSKIKFKWMSVSQHRASQHQYNLKYGESLLKTISTIRSMWYMRKSYFGDGVYSNYRVRPRGRNLFQKQQSGLSFGTNWIKRYCSKSPHGNVCPTSSEANIQINSKRTPPVLVKAFGTMGVG